MGLYCVLFCATVLSFTVVDACDREFPAFQAYLTGSMTGSDDEVILFQEVSQNIGGGYSNETGTFTATANGIYLFHVHTCTAYGRFAYLRVKVNGVIIGGVLGADPSWGDCNGGQWVVRLVTGDTAQVTSHPSSYLHVDTTYGYRPYFVGARIS